MSLSRRNFLALTAAACAADHSAAQAKPARLLGVTVMPEFIQTEGIAGVLKNRGNKARGRSKPLLWEWRFRIFGEPFHRSPQLAIRDDDWKLLLNPDRSRVELYDIARDPTQLNNVADKHPDVVARLSKQALAWQKTLPPGPAGPTAGRSDYRWPGRK